VTGELGVGLVVAIVSAAGTLVALGIVALFTVALSRLFPAKG